MAEIDCTGCGYTLEPDGRAIVIWPEMRLCTACIAAGGMPRAGGYKVAQMFDNGNVLVSAGEGDTP